MKIRLQVVEVEMTEEEMKGPVGQVLSLWARKNQALDDKALLPIGEIARQLEMTAEAFRTWLYRDPELQKVAYLSDGTLAPPKSKMAKYFRLSEVRPLCMRRRRIRYKDE